MPAWQRGGAGWQGGRHTGMGSHGLMESMVPVLISASHFRAAQKIAGRIEHAASIHSIAAQSAHLAALPQALRAPQ